MATLVKNETVLNDKVSNSYNFLTVIALGFIPILVHTYKFQNEFVQYSWFSNNDAISLDVFLAYKSWAITIVAGIMILSLIFRTFSDLESMRWEKPFWCIAVYAAMVMISALTSRHIGIAFTGSFEMFESVGVVVGYMVLFFYAYNGIKSEENLKWVVKWFLPFFIFMLVIGLLQSAGIDPISFKAVRYLIASPEYRETLHSNRIPGTAYMTMYNENYLSLYFGVLIPVIIGFLVAAKKMIGRIAAAVILVASIIVLIHGHSSSGWFGLAASGIVVTTVYLSRIKSKYPVLPIGIGIMALAVVLTVVFVAPVRQKLKDAFTSVTVLEGIQNMQIEDITTGDEIVFYLTEDRELHTVFYPIDNENFGVTFKDKSGNELTVASQYKGMRLDDSNYPETSVTFFNDSQQSGYLGADYTVDGREWIFIMQSDNSFLYLNPFNKPVQLTGRPAKVDLFADNFFSWRGIIWNYCIPRLGHHMITGCGTNLFITDYPQDDYIYKNYLNGRTSFSYDVKAHCFYIHQWMENGFIAMMAMIVLFVWYFIRSVIIYRRADFKDSLTIVGFGMFAGCLAHIIIFLANDSNVCTSPVFWTVFGISFAVNRILSERIDMPEKTLFKKQK